jgi:hypothetical protein
MQLEHFKVPVYPVPKTPAHVAPPKEEVSHLSVPSITLFPHLASQLLSLIRLHPVGQHPSLLIQEVIDVCEQTLFEQVSLVHESISIH